MYVTRDNHNIFWLNLVPFGMCIYTLNANRNICRNDQMLGCISEVFDVASIIYLVQIITADVTPPEL